MKTAILFGVSFALMVPLALYAQVPEWENAVQLNIPSGRSMESAFSNGYGQHLGVARSTLAKHYLVANDGATIFQSPDLGASQQGVTAVTAFGAFVNVAVKQNIAAGRDVIRLWRSSNGGENWPPTPLVYDRHLISLIRS